MNELTLNIRTMSSREIAELTGKEHRNVMRDIRDMLEQLRAAGGGLLNFERTYRDSQNKEQPEFLLPKRECLILVSGYSVLLRTRIIDRWAELEAAQTSALALPDFRNPAAAARAWADQFERRQRAEFQAAELASENSTLKPKALIADKIYDADGLYTMAQAGKILGIGRNRLFDWLRENHVFIGREPLQKYKEAKYFDLKSRTYMRGDELMIDATPYVTGKGIVWLTPKVAGLGPDGQGEFFE